MLKKALRLRNLRRIYSVFFLVLFLVLVYLTRFDSLKGYRTGLFLESDPLLSISSFLTSLTLYRGMAFSLIILIGTLFFGRFFCSWICPLGILNHWASQLFNRKKNSEDYKENSYRKIYRIKYYLLGFFLVLALFGILQTGLMDPISLVYRSFILSFFPAAQKISESGFSTQSSVSGGLLISLVFLAILLANRFITRFWCRALCPLGALLGILALASPMRIRRDVDKCNDCKKCLKDCQGASSPDKALRVTECHLCMNCIENCPEDAQSYGLAKPRHSVHQPLDLGRRRLLETAVVAGFFAPMVWAAYSSRTLALPGAVRPPGSLAEADFLRRCIKCGLCMKVCPTGTLQPAIFESGLEGFWTPVFDFKVGYCEHHCVLCSQVCPTGAIEKIEPEQKIGAAPFGEPIKIGTAFFDRGRCLPWAMDTPCIVCEEVCPTSPKAIWFEEVEIQSRNGGLVKLKRPLLDPEKCIGCGICENKCPVADQAAILVTSVGETRSKSNRMILSRKDQSNKNSGKL